MTFDGISAVLRTAAARRRTAFHARLDDLSLRRRSLIGSALARILLGALGFYYYARDYVERTYLWGPDGIWPWQNFTGPGGGEGVSLYSVSRSEIWFEAVFHLGMLAALLFMLGWRTRVTTVLHYVFLWSLHQRNPVLLDGGDNVMAIVLVFFLCIDSGARFSLDSRRRGKRDSEGRTGTEDGRASLRSRSVSLVHNAGVLAVVLQVCTVYLVSGMYKVQGERWQNGTALYYILRVDEFGWPGVNRYIYESALLVVALTYATVFFQLAFSFLLLHRRWRVFAVAGGVLLHVGIGFHMAGLITFSLTMVALELVIMGDAHYRRLRRILRARPAEQSGTAVPSSAPVLTAE
ncbi:HTTM domain-containing protein [Streptomyces sp. PKU-EA00015]|uniref:HTTM domain-containing protein n=1 Tax=Streptomyces sp. PKU-EA00015 TaxID=2748326 RepID=UPI0015A25CA1|nr:HTTM domain-containing protein [Streptomyces sp. PKU-EA00015]NWF29636.1 HTTM domain-containing protein [Streptomyces sp. PKU-EA00015]